MVLPLQGSRALDGLRRPFGEEEAMRKCHPVMFLVALALAAYGRISVDAAAWVNVTGNLAFQPTECGNMSYVSAKPGSDIVIAGVAQRGLWYNRGGNTWTPLGTGTGSDRITNRTSSIVYDPQDL